MTGRYAPSPTGAMHLGNARTALLAWLAARSQGASFVLRIEDLDRPRIVAGAEARLLDDLRWLGLDWDQGPDVGGPHAPYRQSQRARHYDDAMTRLLAAGRAYPCACSRADIARAASAPHDDDEEGPRYPGTCRGLDPAAVTARAIEQGRRPSIRFDGRGQLLGFVDGIAGVVAPTVVDDFVLRRADGVAAYQLAVVVDDAAMAIQQVVRGADLLRSTARQLALFHALGYAPPAFAHAPLVLSPVGERLAKRSRPLALATLRERGLAPETVVGRLAASAGLCAAGAAVSARELVTGFQLARIERGPVSLDEWPVPITTT